METDNLQQISKKITDLENYFLNILKKKNPKAYSEFFAEINQEQKEENETKDNTML